MGCVRVCVCVQEPERLDHLTVEGNTALFGPNVATTPKKLWGLHMVSVFQSQVSGERFVDEVQVFVQDFYGQVWHGSAVQCSA